MSKLESNRVHLESMMKVLVGWEAELSGIDSANM